MSRTEETITSIPGGARGKTPRKPAKEFESSQLKAKLPEHSLRPHEARRRAPRRSELTDRLDDTRVLRGQTESPRATPSTSRSALSRVTPERQGQPALEESVPTWPGAAHSRQLAACVC